METKLVRIAEISATTKHPIFTSVYHLINEDMLKQCHKELDGSKAVGIDKVTKDEYGKNLDRNIKDLVQRLKNKSFKPLPSLRVYIPKANGKKRPLGIASYEDKIVQMAVKKILGAIYEPRFLNCMYGFRLNRGCHEAIKEVYQRISYGKISYIVDADIKGFFDHIDHEWMMKFLEWNIQDKNLLWLIRKYLKAGIMEQGKFEPTEEGSAQGSVMSPMLANIYMHHVLTLWFKLVVQREMQGECFLVNFADDFVAGFQYKSEAERYYKELKERMEKFGLELESSKSRLIEFGRFAEQNRRARGECKPETFDFLGFTFYCSKTRKGGFVPKVQTSRKKFEQKVRAYKNWIYDNRNRPMREIIKELNVKLIGHYRYYGVTWNFRKITTFLHRVQQFLFKAMNRRGCRRAYTWNGFVQMLKYYPLAKPETSCQGLFNQIHKKATKKCQKHFHAPDTQAGGVTFPRQGFFCKRSGIPATVQGRAASAALSRPIPEGRRSVRCGRCRSSATHPSTLRKTVSGQAARRYRRLHSPQYTASPRRFSAAGSPACQTRTIPDTGFPGCSRQTPRKPSQSLSFPFLRTAFSCPPWLKVLVCTIISLTQGGWLYQPVTSAVSRF